MIVLGWTRPGPYWERSRFDYLALCAQKFNIHVPTKMFSFFINVTFKYPGDLHTLIGYLNMDFGW